MKHNQSKERKQASKYYCGIHRVHYIDECPYCSGYQKTIDNKQTGGI